MESKSKYLAAVIGAGPAGLFAARELVSQNVHVILINRDIKPGGLAEYGIYPSKLRMKDGLRAQFRQILDLEDLDYYGNVTVGEQGDISLAMLRSAGIQAILVTTGAQGTKWLGLPGENLMGVYHAKDLVYHYNSLPPFSQIPFRIGRRAAIIGAGNVMLDIAHFLSTQPQVEEITAIIRRGPSEVKFTKVELEYVARLIDLEDLMQELDRVTPVMKSIGQDPNGYINLVNAALSKAEETTSKAKIKFRFLMSPHRMLEGENGQLGELEVEENCLVLAEEGQTKAHALGILHRMELETVIFAIGDRVDSQFGIPVIGSEFAKNPQPTYPMDGNSYEAYDPIKKRPLDGVFVAGWSRQASTGLVGVARRDGTMGARALLQYLQTLPLPEQTSVEPIEQRLFREAHCTVRYQDVKRLEEIEHHKAAELGLEEFKFGSNQEMLEALGLLPVPLSGKDTSLG